MAKLMPNEIQTGMVFKLVKQDRILVNRDSLKDHENVFFNINNPNYIPVGDLLEVTIPPKKYRGINKVYWSHNGQEYWSHWSVFKTCTERL